MVSLDLDTSSINDYRRFLKIKGLPTYNIRGRSAQIPDEYAERIGIAIERSDDAPFVPSPFCFDYQRDIAKLAIEKRKFSVFADCGLGKTVIMLEFARHAFSLGERVLIVSPLMVIPQTIEECRKFYGDAIPIEQVRAADLQDWLDGAGPAVAITNYEALTGSLRQGNLGALLADESSMLKSHYGKWGTTIVRLGKGLEWKLALTGTPAPNDRIEYANHAVFCDAFRTVNEFLARYFVNRGQTQNRWEIKPHALRPFYKDLAHWCIFLSNPAVYGWKDNCETIPPIHVHIDRVPLTQQQIDAVQSMTGNLFASASGGISTRGKLGQIAKGKDGISTNKPSFIRQMVGDWKHESSIIWCIYNDEQTTIEREFPDAASLRGETPIEQRIEMVNEFKRGERQQLISKAKILGFGLNLQIATRHVFSGLQDSYESYYQCVKRSNRIGSTKPLNVHIPITEVEEPMVETVLRKADRVQKDTEEQEKIFKEMAWTC